MEIETYTTLFKFILFAIIMYLVWKEIIRPLLNVKQKRTNFFNKRIKDLNCKGINKSGKSIYEYKEGTYTKNDLSEIWEDEKSLFNKKISLYDKKNGFLVAESFLLKRQVYIDNFCSKEDKITLFLDKKTDDLTWRIAVKHHNYLIGYVDKESINTIVEIIKIPHLLQIDDIMNIDKGKPPIISVYIYYNEKDLII